MQKRYDVRQMQDDFWILDRKEKRWIAAHMKEKDACQIALLLNQFEESKKQTEPNEN